MSREGGYGASQPDFARRLIENQKPYREFVSEVTAAVLGSLDGRFVTRVNPAYVQSPAGTGKGDKAIRVTVDQRNVRALLEVLKDKALPQVIEIVGKS